MRRLLYTVLVLVISVTVLDCCAGSMGPQEAEMQMTRDKAIEIANVRSKQLGYIIENMNIEATKYNTPWNEYLPKDSTDKYHVEKRNRLNNREYWAVYYYPMAGKGGDFCIFVDANTGEIIMDIRWK